MTWLLIHLPSSSLLAIGYTWKPLQLSFCVKPSHPSASLLLKCAITDATNYDILVNEQAFYPFWFWFGQLD